MKWYKRDPDAALVGMTGLTWAERGLYNAILDLLYSCDGKITPDQARRCLHCNPRTWRMLTAKLFAKGKIWIKLDGNLTAIRVELELNSARIRLEFRANAKQKAKEINDDMAVRAREQPQPQPHLHKEREDIYSSSVTDVTNDAMHKSGNSRKKVSSIPPSIIQAEFEKFWRVYPRRVGKQTALKAFVKARKSVELGVIVAKLEKLIPTWTPEFTKHPATWLNSGGWEDELPAKTNSNSANGGHVNGGREQREREATSWRIEQFKRRSAEQLAERAALEGKHGVSGSGSHDGPEAVEARAFIQRVGVSLKPVLRRND